MKIDIISIMNRGQPNEYLILSVLSDADLSYYIVLGTRYITPQSITSAAKFTHWFAARPVKAGDLVLLYTGTGTDATTTMTDGKTAHHIYWGLPGPVWKSTGDCAVLLEVNTWKTSKYE